MGRINPIYEMENKNGPNHQPVELLNLASSHLIPIAAHLSVRPIVCQEVLDDVQVAKGDPLVGQLHLSVGGFRWEG